MKMLDKMPYCFTKEDVIFNFTNKFQFDNWLKTKIAMDALIFQNSSSSRFNFGRLPKELKSLA